MSLKLIVNNPELYEALQAEFKTRLEQEQKGLVSESDPVQIYRRQGAALLLGKLLRLREDVNARKS